jgi:hypothetical protein
VSSRRTHFQDPKSVFITQTLCGLRLPARELWRMRADIARVVCKRCRLKWDQLKARAE